MSTGTRTAGADGASAGGLPGALVPGEFSRPRLLATGSVALVVVAYLSILYDVANVTGDATPLLMLAVGAVVAATVLARLLSPRPALGLTALMLGAGGYVYLGTLPRDLGFAAVAGPILADSISLLTGLSVLRIVNAGLWALAITPGPTFLAWYLAVRERFVASAAVAGATLGLFVLTGDASTALTLLGAIGVAAAIGFAELRGRRGSAVGAETLAVVLAAMVVLTLTVGVVPGGSAQPITPIGGAGGGDTTVEASLVDTDNQVTIQGAIELSPTVRFTVESDEPRYWKVASFDRFTGQGWVRTGGEQAYDGSLSTPPGRTRTVRQRFRAEDRLNVLPAAWKPRTFESDDVGARVTDDGDLRPTSQVVRGETYRVRSHVVAASPERLRAAGTAYPDRIEQRFTQLPSNTPDRVAERTARITANADNPYETALVVEQWLQNNKEYSLDVERPGGNIADAFLFEMEAGYCTYFASTMVTMLRSQGIPARFVVGYTPGERVAEDRWVARGLDSHAWVEVYFPDVGWVRFDPTPADPRERAEQARVIGAREQNLANVDTNETGPGEWTPTPTTPTPTTPTPTTPTPTANGTSGAAGVQTQPGFGTEVGGSDGDTGGGFDPELPTREEAALGLVVLAGVVAGVRRTGLADRAYRTVWLRVQPRRDPATDVANAYDRLEYLLGRRYRPRRPGETVRQYARAVGDERVRRVAEIYERSRYAGEVDEAAADEAVDTVDELVGEGTVLGR